MPDYDGDDLVVPDLIEAIEAWRVWHIFPGLPVLHSVFKQLPFVPGKPAECVGQIGMHRRTLRGLEKAPVEQCRCGYYSTKTIDELGLAASVFTLAEYSVIARVQLWGKVLVGERGYRSEYMAPMELYYHRQNERQWVERAAEIARVPAYPLSVTGVDWADNELLEKLDRTGQTLTVRRNGSRGMVDRPDSAILTRSEPVPGELSITDPGSAELSFATVARCYLSSGDRAVFFQAANDNTLFSLNKPRGA